MSVWPGRSPPPPPEPCRGTPPRGPHERPQSFRGGEAAAPRAEPPAHVAALATARSPRAHSASRSSSSSCAPSSHASRPSMVARGPAPPPSRRGAAARPAAARLGAQPRRDCGELIPAGSAPRAQRRARAARPQPLRGPRAAPQRRACRPLGAGTRSSPPRAHSDPAQPPQSRSQHPAPPAPGSGHQGCPTPWRRPESGESLGKPSGRGWWGWGREWSRCVAPPTSPQALVTCRQRRPHLGPDSPSPSPSSHPRWSLFMSGQRGLLESAQPWGVGDAVCVCRASWPRTPEVHRHQHGGARVHTHSEVQSGDTAIIPVFIDWAV